MQCNTLHLRKKKSPFETFFFCLFHLSSWPFGVKKSKQHFWILVQMTFPGIFNHFRCNLKRCTRVFFCRLGSCGVWRKPHDSLMNVMWAAYTGPIFPSTISCSCMLFALFFREKIKKWTFSIPQMVPLTFAKSWTLYQAIWKHPLCPVSKMY